MNARLVMALLLPLLLLFIQIEGQPMVADFKDVDDTSANLDENPNTVFEPSVSVEEAPLSIPESATFPNTSVLASTPVFELEPTTESTTVSFSPLPGVSASPAVETSPTPGKSVFPSPVVETSPTPGTSASPAPVSSATPLSSPSRRFEDRINQEIAQCRRETGLPSCSWRNGYIFISQGLVVEEEISDDLCCCACHLVDECQAAHYERREGKCVFHQGPIRRGRRQGGTKGWRK